MSRTATEFPNSVWFAGMAASLAFVLTPVSALLEDAIGRPLTTAVILVSGVAAGWAFDLLADPTGHRSVRSHLARGWLTYLLLFGALALFVSLGIAMDHLDSEVLLNPPSIALAGCLAGDLLAVLRAPRSDHPHSG